MNWRKFLRFSLPCLAIGITLLPQTVSACATCFGQSDSKLAQGMNMGILSLLGVVVCVLGAIAAFFIYLARRSAVTPLLPVAEGSIEASETHFK